MVSHNKCFVQFIGEGAGVDYSWLLLHFDLIARVSRTFPMYKYHHSVSASAWGVVM